MHWVACSPSGPRIESRSMTRAGWYAEHRLARSARRLVESKVSLADAASVMTDMLLYGTAEMPVDFDAR